MCVFMCLLDEEARTRSLRCDLHSAVQRLRQVAVQTSRSPAGVEVGARTASQEPSPQHNHIPRPPEDTRRRQPPSSLYSHAQGTCGCFHCWSSELCLMCVFTGVCVCLQEMLQNGHAVTQETFHYLLMGCLKDKETGFRLALQVDA